MKEVKAYKCEFFKKKKSWWTNFCFHEWEFFDFKRVKTDMGFDVVGDYYYVCMKCGKKKVERVFDSIAQECADDIKRLRAARKKASQ